MTTATTPTATAAREDPGFDALAALAAIIDDELHSTANVTHGGVVVATQDARELAQVAELAGGQGLVVVGTENYVGGTYVQVRRPAHPVPEECVVLP